ncbi:alpha-2-macroglobulin-like protein 1 [Pyxicephalus adspersus]|uniref:alpha-2-macroglobulin-like protein 1 n=1 Tax=Pyxicephalus adspersus TaxID=30357 RepID=UPI003B5ABCAF
MCPNMELLLVSICLAICSSAFVSASDPHYVITVPYKLEGGSQEKACVTIQDLNCELHLKLELKKGDHIEVIAEQDITAHDYSHCFTFQVPSVDHDSKDWVFHASGQGEHLKIDDSKKVFIAKKHYSCVIQTDKSTYKPNEIVKLRLVSVDHNYQPSNEKYEKILLLDPNGNYIGQWLDVTPDHGIVDLQYHLANELKLGSYKIIIPDRCQQVFTVAEYVSKRFEVTIKSPPTVTFSANSFHLEVCGIYTYGKKVQGNLDIKICKESYHNWGYLRYNDDDYYDDQDDEEQESEKCINIKHAKTDSNGCLSRDIDLHVFNFSAEERHHLHIKSSLTEDGTGHTESASVNVNIINHQNVQFVDTGFFYHSGVPFNCKVKVTNADDQPIADAAVHILQATEDGYKTLIKLKTGKDGLAQCSLDTNSWTKQVILSAVFPSEEGNDEGNIVDHLDHRTQLWLFPFYSESHSLLSVETRRDTMSCDSDQSVTVDFHISMNPLDSKQDHISFFYMTLSEDDGIHSHEEYKLDMTSTNKASDGSTLHGSFPIKIHLDDHLSPQFSVLVYIILSNGETIAAMNHFEVSSCFKNKVQLKFSEEQVHPGGKVNLEVSAEPGSLCSVRSIDKGYLLKYPQDRSSFAEKIKYSLRRPPVYLTPWDIENDECLENRAVGFFWQEMFDSSFMFKVSNLNIITNTHIRKQVKCDEVGGRSTKLKQAKQDEVRPLSTRRFFQDTWLFDIVAVGPEGHTVLNLTAPDSITKWETDAVCLGKSGIGEIRDVELTTFKPYFIDLIMPYSVVQGEKLKIQAQVFSYDSKCILVGVFLSDADGIDTVQNKDQVRCVCNGHVSHFSWDATASKLNKIKINVQSGSLHIDGDCKEDPLLITKEHDLDSIEKTLEVKPSGYEGQITQTHILYSEDTTKKVTFTLTTPDRLIPGTERAHIIVLGDIMGNIVVNLENLVNLPDGCGEQSISKLSRYCSSLEYLQSSNELTPETKEKFLEHLVEGYQKVLTFQNTTGAFAFFNGGSPNIWITALAVQAISCVQQFIFIDQKNIQEALHWLEETQQPNGCFNNSDSYFCNDIDDDDELSQTAFILIALLEHPIVYNGSIIEKAKSCITKGAANAKKPHTLSMLAYAFTLLGDSELRALMLKRLDDKAETHSGSKHWLSSNYRHGDIEISAYVIMARLSDKTITHQDLEESAHSVRWLASQQNPWGGFSSSRDTTTALQALAKYAKATKQKKGDSTVTIEDDSGFHKEIHIDDHNSLLLHTVDLPKVPGTYTANIKGNGCVYIQSHLHYYSLPDEHDHHFSVNVTTNPAVCSRDAQEKFDVHIDARYTGKRPKTNMVVIKAELLSGYVPDSKSIRKLRRNHEVARVDTLPGEIEIYLHELDHENQHFVFTIQKETHVENLQPANILVYDYYVPVVHSHAEYNTPCSEAHCNVRASERKDCGAPGITKEQCEEKGCCYDTSVVDAKWCFFHGVNIVEVKEDHHSEETQHTQEAH